MSGHNHLKKDGVRKEKKTARRRRDSEQPILGSVSSERGQATSNFTDGDIAGGDWKHDEEGHLKRRFPSEPRSRR